LGSRVEPFHGLTIPYSDRTLRSVHVNELINEMREYLKTVDWDHGLIGSVSAPTILRAINRVYPGGIKGFGADTADKWARELGWTD
jgi:hypothetical protein